MRLIDKSLLWLISWRIRATTPIVGRLCFADAVLKLLGEQVEREAAAARCKGLVVVSKRGNKLSGNVVTSKLEKRIFT